MEGFEIGWLAGVLEGEGYFGVSRRGQSYQFTIKVSMTDEDVIRQLHLVTGEGHVTGPRLQSGMGWKPVWTWQVANRRGVARLLLAVYPVMGERRQQRISEMAMSPWKKAPYPRENHYNVRKTHCRWGHPFSDDNLYYFKSGKRGCRACAKERYEKRRALKLQVLHGADRPSG